MIDPFDLPHHEAAERLRQGVVFVPVNPVEYHGPHLSLHTDHLLSLGLIRALAPALGLQGELLVTADLEMGVEPTPGPGTRPTSYRALCRTLDRTCEGLVALGARRVVLVTFHGAPLHNLALARAVRGLQDNGIRAVAPFQELVRLLAGDVDSLWDERFVEGVDPHQRQMVREQLALDFHAGFFETSLALYWAPDSVSPLHRSLPPCPEPGALRPLGWASALAGRLGALGLQAELAFASRAAAWMRLDPFPGYTGRPSQANALAGAAFSERIVGYLAPMVREVLEGGQRAPAPPFGWVGPLTLWGALGV